MNKRITLSAALIVMLVTALTGSALAVTVAGPAAVSTGDTVVVTVSAPDPDPGVSGRVMVEGLRVESVEGGWSSMRDLLLLAKEGKSVSTYTCTVTARAGENVTFAVTDVTVSDGVTDSPGTSDAWTATVEGAFAPGTGTASSDPASAGNKEPDRDEGVENASSAGVTSKTTSGAKDGLPKTADASLDLWTLGLISAACAIIAILAGKRAFSEE